MPDPITPRHYDERVATGMHGAGELLTGLPEYLGIRTVEVGPARMVAELDVRPELLNPFGTAHGGVVAGLVDHVLGAVLYPVIERGRWAATTEFKLNLLRAVREGTLRAEATIVAMTRTTAVVQVEVFNDGTLACLAQGTVLIPEPRVARTVHTEARQALVAGGLVLGYGAAAGRAPEGTRLPANLAAAAGLVVLSRRWGRSWSDLGLHPADVPAGIAVGAATVPVIASALGVGAALPPARGLFSDERVLGLSRWEAWRKLLVQVPLETALAEEVLFRGVLLGLTRAAAPDRVAVAATALAFGVWHVLPALESHRSNPGAADAAEGVGGAGAVVASTVLATAAAGVAFAWLRLRSRSVVAPVLAHAALNSLAFVATHWVDRRRAARSVGPVA